MLRLKCVGTGSKGNCYLLESDDGILVLDAGLPMKTIKQALDYDFSKVKGVLITHSHKDHIRSASEFVYMGIPVYTMYSSDMKSADIGTFKVRSFPVPHDAPCVGYFIQVDGITTVYITDAGYCRWNFRNHRVENFIIECNWQDDYILEDSDESVVERVVQTHMSEDVCVRFLEANKTENMSNILICHMSHKHCCPEAAVERIQKTLGQGINIDFCRPNEIYKLERRTDGNQGNRDDQ